MLFFVKKTLHLTIAIAVLGLLFLFSTLWYFSSDLPDYKILANYKPPVSSRVHSGEGNLIAEYALQKRLFIPYNSIPKKVIYSFLSAEDKNFFSHPGVDAKSITRATIKNLKNSIQKFWGYQEIRLNLMKILKQSNLFLLNYYLILMKKSVKLLMS